MNILFLSSVFPDAASPSRGAYNLATCRALANDHQVRVVSPRPWAEALMGRLRGQQMHPCAAARSAGLIVDYPTSWYPPKVLRERYGDFMWWSVRRSVERMTRDFRPDAVLSYWAHPDGETAVRVGKRFGVPVAVVAGGSDVLLLPRCPRRGKKIRSVLQQADAVVTVSEGVRQTVLDMGIAPNRVHTVYQGIDEKIFYPKSKAGPFHVQRSPANSELSGDRPLLLWVGRMVDVKRLDVLIDGLALLRERGRDVSLCLIGNGPERPKVEQQVAALGLTERVHFLGSLPPHELGDWYRAADLTVLTSDSEGLPNVLRESVACGTPFVSTDIGSVRELADEPIGMFVPPGDPQSLADAIAETLDRPLDPDVDFPLTRNWIDRAGEIVDVLLSCRAEGTPSLATGRRTAGVPA